MDLRTRLARLDPLARRDPAAGGPPPVAATRGAPAAGADLLREALGLQPAATPAGTVWLREDHLPEVAPPPWPPADLRGILPAAARLPAGWQEVLLLDTETTGLCGGTGTLAFLVGLGWWHDGGLTVRQLFLPEPHLEAPLLVSLAAVADRFGAVVTYNGAAFDLPLLRTRARLNRRDDPCRDLASWDLLTAARRLWGRALPDCRQQTVEERVCGWRRGPGDIAGDQIPGLYRDFVHEAAIVPLTPVLTHNRRDIAGLGRLLGALCAAAATVDDGPRDWSGPAPSAWSGALICERRRQRRRAAAWAACLVERDQLGELPLGGVLDVVRLLKRAAAWTPAAAAVAHGLGRWPEQKRLHYEAAVLYEHRLGDLPRALDHAAALQDERRLRRLHARLARLGAAAAAPDAALATAAARGIVRRPATAGGDGRD